MNTIVVNIYNGTYTDEKNYLTCIEMPKYKQVKRSVTFLRNWLKLQKGNDFNHRRIMYYVFEANMFLFSETELENYDKD